MDPIARAEADAEPEPEFDLDDATIDAHLSAFLPHLVQPPRTRAVDQAKLDVHGEPEPEPDLDLAKIDDHLSTSLKHLVQTPRSLPIHSVPLKRSFYFNRFEHIRRAERCMGQDDIDERFESEVKDPDVPAAIVIDSVDAHEQSVGVASTGDLCSICYCVLKVGPLLCAPPCGHLFHDKCLLEAMRVDPQNPKKYVSKNCPYCRGDFPDGN